MVGVAMLPKIPISAQIQNALKFCRFKREQTCGGILQRNMVQNLP
jgi:hypothetical protein